MSLRIGISAYDFRARDFVTLARSADELGFDTLWLGEHLVLPATQDSEHPAARVDLGTWLQDLWGLIGAVSTATERLRIGTGIYVAPLRHPLVTARASITAHQLSGGRFVMGLGAGWLGEEFEALGVPFTRRMSRLEETVAILKSAWRGDPVRHTGRNFQFDVLPLTPEPAEIPLVLGGNSDRALERAAAHADGWIASGAPSIGESLALLSRLARLREQARPGEPIRRLVRVSSIDPAVVRDYAAAGVDDIVVRTNELSPTGAIDECVRNLRRLSAALELA